VRFQSTRSEDVIPKASENANHVFSVNLEETLYTTNVIQLMQENKRFKILVCICMEEPM
jgi:hypothetical protein